MTKSVRHWSMANVDPTAEVEVEPDVLFTADVSDDPFVVVEVVFDDTSG